MPSFAGNSVIFALYIRYFAAIRRIKRWFSCDFHKKTTVFSVRFGKNAPKRLTFSPNADTIFSATETLPEMLPTNSGRLRPFHLV